MESKCQDETLCFRGMYLNLWTLRMFEDTFLLYSAHIVITHRDIRTPSRYPACQLNLRYSSKNKNNQQAYVVSPSISEFQKWTLQTLNWGMFIDANRGFSLK